jgi:hypothetical protein
MKNRALIVYRIFVFLVLIGAGYLVYYFFDKYKADFMPASTITTTTTEETTRTRRTYETEPTTTTEVITTEPTTTTTTTTKKTTTKAQTTKKTTKTTKKSTDADPLTIGIKIRYIDEFIIGEFSKAEGGVYPYTYELKLYKNGQLIGTSNDDSPIAVPQSPTESAVFKLYGKIIDATGDSIEAEREMTWN